MFNENQLILFFSSSAYVLLMNFLKRSFYLKQVNKKYSLVSLLRSLHLKNWTLTIKMSCVKIIFCTFLVQLILSDLREYLLCILSNIYSNHMQRKVWDTKEWDLIREGFKNKKKKYGIFHNRAGGVYPIPHFFIYLFSDSKVTIFNKFWVLFSVLPSYQTFNTITFHSIFEQPNNL